MGILKKLTEILFRKKELDVDSEKEKLRAYIKHRKKSVSDTQRSNDSKKVFDKIEELVEFKNAKTILLYWSMPDELETHNFIVKWCVKKQILLPVVKGDEMLIKPFSSKKELRMSHYGAWEPDSQKEFESNIDLIIAPGIAFDKGKNRLGRGKGYYDRYFAKKSVTKIGIGFDFQLFNKIPINQYDVRLDKVITPSSLIE